MSVTWQDPPQPTVRNRGRTAVLIVAGVVLVVALIVTALSLFPRDVGSTSAAAATATPAADTRLTDAYDRCRNGGIIKSADGGDTLIVNHFPESADSTRTFDCLLTELAVPTSIVTEMEQTSSLMGRQQASHDDLDYSWTYHPDDGLDLIITKAGQP